MTFSPLDSALLGPLFTTADMAQCFSDTARVGAMLAAEAALARAQSGLGLVPGGLTDAIEAIPAESLGLAALGAATAVSGVPTIPFIAAVQKRLPPELAPSFHKGATTQDILDTALVLQLRPALALVAADLDAVLTGLAVLADAHRATPCVGRTYGQHAAPVTFGYKAAVWLTGVGDSAAALPALRSRLLVASLGGPVGMPTAFGAQGPAVLEAFARELGLGTTPLAWHTLRGRMAEAGAWVLHMLGALAKLATDVASLASTDIGEVAEPYVPGRGGSSAMPHKRNPVSSTVILAAHGAAKGLALTLFDAMAAAHERPAGAWHAEWHALPSLFGLLAGALREARALAEGLQVDAGRMLGNMDLTRGLLFADAAAACLAPKLGRAGAHAAVEQAADKVRRSGATLQTVLKSEYPAMPELLQVFELAPGVGAAGPWIDRALDHAGRVRSGLAGSADTVAGQP